MKTCATTNGLTIWGKEDSWRLEFVDKGNAMRLMHNNYHPLPDETRIFTPGYHVQAERATVRHALTVIAGYTYEGHKARMAQKVQEAQEQQSEELSKDRGIPPKPRMFIRWLWRVVKGYLAKLFSTSKY